MLDRTCDLALVTSYALLSVYKYFARRAQPPFRHEEVISVRRRRMGVGLPHYHQSYTQGPHSGSDQALNFSGVDSSPHRSWLWITLLTEFEEFISTGTYLRCVTRSRPPAMSHQLLCDQAILTAILATSVVKHLEIAILAGGRRVLISDSHCLDDVTVMG